MYVNKVDVTFPARIEPFSAADGRRTWDMCAQFIVCSDNSLNVIP